MLSKMPNKKTFLTKSRYVNGLQCSKWVWLAFNKPEELPEVDEATQHRFDEGRRVGELAKSLFPEGIEVKEQLNHQENDKESRELLKKRKPLFEAGFIHKNGKCYARADTIVPTGKNKNEWDIYEIKSSTEVKEEYIWDIAFQKYCYESAGLKIRNCFVVHINNKYVKQGEVEPKEFFTIAPVSDKVEAEMENVEDNIKKLFKIINSKECPEIKVGESCCLGREEYEKKKFNIIHEKDKFWKEHPECNIFDLYYGRKRAIELFNHGILCIKDLDESSLTKKQQKIQHKVAKTGKPHIDKEEITSFIKSLKYPLYFMDFETYATAIPLYDGLKPYQAIPFQFSVHVIKKSGVKPEHHSFIVSGSKDPRKEFAKNLKSAIGESGTVLSYYQSFEKSRLKELAEFLPKNVKWIENVIGRMIDLYDPFKSFSYYHSSQKGSASLKKVLPALTGKDYKGLEIDNGTDASLAYLFITHGSYGGEKATSEEIKKVRANLEKYCGRDTEGMIWILEKLEKLIN